MSDLRSSRSDLFLAPMLEGALILLAGLLGWAMHYPLLFASLGPTAYEMIETPHRPTARPYNILAGHLIGVLSGFAALAITNAWSAPPVAMTGVPLPRVWAALIAAFLTVFFTLLIRATQPAAVSTTLLVATGTLHTWQSGMIIMSGVVIVTAAGEPLRRWRLRRQKDRERRRTEPR